MKKRNLFLLVSILLVLTGTGISYASTQATAKISVKSGGFASVFQAADANVPGPGKYGTTNFSSWQPAAGTSGTTGSGDLYIIQRAAGATEDLYGTLYLSNSGALSRDYSYLNMNIHIYGTNDITASPVVWTDVTSSVLSLANGYINFTLDSTYRYYSISVDNGSYYCVSTTDASGTLSPGYYIEIK